MVVNIFDNNQNNSFLDMILFQVLELILRMIRKYLVNEKMLLPSLLVTICIINCLD